MKFSWRCALVTLASLLLTASGLATPAMASLPDDVVVSDDPADFTPRVEGPGVVMSVAQVGNTVVAVGNFTTVTHAGSTFARTNIFAFDATTGVVSATFVPQVNAVVNKVIPAEDGQSVYIGGRFTKVNNARASHVARLAIASGQLVTGFRAPSINGAVNDLALRSGRLYVGGAFKKVAGQDHTLLAALNPTSGKVTDAVRLAFSETHNGGTTNIRSLDVDPSGSRLVAVGNFRSVDGQSRPQIAMIDTGVTPAVVDTWATQRFSTPCASKFDTYMWDVSISPGGDYFAVATTGAFSGGLSSGTLCDTITRWELSSSGPDQNPTWIDYSGGDTLTAVSAGQRIIYIGGHQRWMNNPYAGDAAGPGAVSRQGLAALDARNGLPLSWNPGRIRGVGVRDFLPVIGGLWIGHDTDWLGGEARKRLAYMPVTGGQALPAELTGDLPGDVYLLGPATGGDSALARAFTGSSAGPDRTLASGAEPWSQSRGAFMVDGVLYYGKSDGTFHRRAFDGSAFGPDQLIDLNGASTQAHPFAAEIPSVTGMFYDADTARLYYTLSDKSRLRYRYFLPESDIVGAVRYRGPRSPTGFSWSNAAGMFHVDDQNKLYMAHQGGTLYSIGWNAGKLSGSATPVVTPQSWAAKGLALQAP